MLHIIHGQKKYVSCMYIFFGWIPSHVFWVSFGQHNTFACSWFKFCGGNRKMICHKCILFAGERPSACLHGAQNCAFEFSFF